MSDTVTKPNPEMLEAMTNAEVGDDVFGEDPTVNALQNMAAQLFGHEAAIFCPSGTMTNQIGLQIHTQALDEVICEKRSHIYKYETGGYAYNGRLAISLIETKDGILSADDIEKAIKRVYDWLPISKLLVIENTSNAAGGIFYTLEDIKPIYEVCRQHSIKLHLDGARLFNALVETKESPKVWGQYFDSISICLSKGLGAPVGSLLISSEKNIKQARRLRKVMGGGMRQTGYLAAAGIYALHNNIDRLITDNNRAKLIAATLEQMPYVLSIKPVHTNILIFDLIDNVSAERFLQDLKKYNILAVAFGPQTIRFVTHLDVTEAMIGQIITCLQSLQY